MNYVYQSNFKQYIEGLIEQKHALGFPYCRSVDYLRRFDQLCLNEFPNETVLTKEIGQKWGMIRDTEKRVSFQDRMAPIRELAKYMLRLGIDAYMDSPAHKAHLLNPRITDIGVGVAINTDNRFYWSLMSFGGNYIW